MFKIVFRDLDKETSSFIPFFDGTFVKGVEEVVLVEPSLTLVQLGHPGV